ncbi:MAG: hypothetical protein K2G69_04025 [Muribaculaceae bacterium]|nr:hypothetical protein [Muribaculaceae bacterium]
MNENRFEAMVVSYSPGPFEFNKEVRDRIKLESLKFSVASRLRYTDDSDFVGLQIDVLVDQEEGRLLTFGFVAGLKISDWVKTLKDGIDLTADRSPLIPACEKVWDMAIGIVASRTYDDKPGFILPPISAARIAEDTILLNSKKSV